MMEKPVKRYTYILLCALAALSLSSCVHEGSLEECPPEGGDTRMVLYVDFAENLYSGGSRSAALKAEVETMYVFVFGHDGYYITTLVDDEPDVGADYIIDVPLPVGDYEFIGWTNLHSCFNLSSDDLVPGQTTVEDLFIELDVLEGDTIADMPSHLHYGLTRTPRTVTDNSLEYLMEIDRYTYTINILTEGLEPDDNDYRYVIADRNGRFGFYSQVIPDRTIYYVSGCDRDTGGQLHSSLRVMRLIEDHLDSRVYIEDTATGDLLFEDNLIDRLLSLREQGELVDFNKKFEYTIKLVFDGGLLVTVYIDDWIVYQHDEYEVNKGVAA